MPSTPYAYCIATFLARLKYIAKSSTTGPPCPEFDLRFTNSTYDYSGTFPVYTVISGNLEICLNGTYVAICDVGWDDEDAQNACNNFGYNEPFYRMLCSYYMRDYEIFTNNK